MATKRCGIILKSAEYDNETVIELHTMMATVLQARYGAEKTAGEEADQGGGWKPALKH